MKVGIITITDGANYGNRLQNYALQVLLEKAGFEVETLRRKTYRDLTRSGVVKDYIKQIAKYFLKRNTSFAYKKRKKKFDRFNKQYIHFSKELLQYNTAPKNIKKRFDFFVCGSDQIWNTRFPVVKDDIFNYLASFADDKQKIAYAASFGTNNIDLEYKDIFRKNLMTFKSIGVRETSGVSIINHLCRRDDITVVLDPTMMLTDLEWRKIAQKPRYINHEKYIVTYFLSGRNSKISDYISEICVKYNAKAINLEVEFITDEKIQNREVYNTTPNEFIWLIDNAECVLTDSFHACAFSILFNKPFIVFQRRSVETSNDMCSRIDTLLNKFELIEFCADIHNPRIFPKEYDAMRIQKLLDIERKKSSDFLFSALHDNNWY